MENKEGRFLDDRESLEAIVATLPKEEFDVYQSFGALTLESAFQGRRFVCYQLDKGRPTRLLTVTTGEFWVHSQDGAFAAVSGMPHPQLGTLPQKVPDHDIFLQIPQNFILKWKGKTTPKGLQFAPHYAVLIKTRSREHLQVDGHSYCVTLNKFRERFPEVPIRY